MTTTTRRPVSGSTVACHADNRAVTYHFIFLFMDIQTQTLTYYNQQQQQQQHTC